MATKKLAEVIGCQDTEAATWQKIRAELRDDIAAAFKLAVEYEGSTELGRMLGLTETARRLDTGRAIKTPCRKPPFDCQRVAASNEDGHRQSAGDAGKRRAGNRRKSKAETRLNHSAR